MDWLVSRWAYLADFYLVPLYFFAAVITAYHIDAHMGFLRSNGVFLGGVFLWTFVEYVLHRFSFHGHFKREHNAHHAYPTKWIGLAPWFTFPLFMAAWFILVKLSENAALGSTVFAGFCCGYYAYIAIHLMIHHRPDVQWRTIAKLRATHEMHHQGDFDSNYGVSTNFWDHIFWTYKAPTKPRPSCFKSNPGPQAQAENCCDGCPSNVDCLK